MFRFEKFLHITLQFPSLVRIRVDDCPKMYAMACTREVGGGENTPFFNDKVLCASLRILIVKGCHNLEYLFPSFLIKSFVGLIQLSLINCENIEEVIYTDESPPPPPATEEGITETYLFTKLKLLELIRLPKLGTFWHGDNSETDAPPLFNRKLCSLT
ncbi:hypothetical protein HRI_001597300 [Hibiscus trionum]|uniref:Disease resistance protein At4g27190-like leucine-rich repeats domain-containing protein n=1 Tax=Hibiscus trionum TaxID=183268 RepID=A0A9W7LY69_HIBTR|nr:hypothetical protein HRI_001597300 [Hibiscus trionum]